MAQLIFPRRAGVGRRCVGRSQRRCTRKAPLRNSRQQRTRFIGSPGTDLIWAGGRLVDAWPVEPRRQPVHERPGFGCRDAADRRPAYDFATPPQRADARARCRTCRTARQVVLPEHRSQRRLLGLPAGCRRPHLINTFFDTRPRRHDPLHAGRRSTSRRASARARSRRSSSPSCSPSPRWPCSRCCWLPLRLRRARWLSGRRQAGCAALAVRQSCSGSAAGSSAR